MLPISLALSEIETAALAEYEAIIERGLQSFVEVGTALLAVRDRRLYRAEYATFEDYCQSGWGLQRAHAYRLMEAAEVVERVSPMGDIVPTSERQARPLTRLPADEQPIAWQRAVETAPNGRVTAGHVERVVREMAAPVSLVSVREDADAERAAVQEAQAVNAAGLDEWERSRRAANSLLVAMGYGDALLRCQPMRVVRDLTGAADVDEAREKLRDWAARAAVWSSDVLRLLADPDMPALRVIERDQEDIAR